LDRVRPCPKAFSYFSALEIIFDYSLDKEVIKMKKKSIAFLMVLVIIFVFGFGLLIGRKIAFKGNFGLNNKYPVFAKTGHFRDRGYGFVKPRNIGMGYLEVVKKEGNKLTVKFPDNSTQEINVSSDALVYTQTKASLDDVKEGDKIVLRGRGGFGQVIIVQK